MKEEMILKCTEKFLAGAEGEDGTEWVRIYEFRFPWNDYHFFNTRFFVVKHAVMDYDNKCWTLFFNDLKTAMGAFGKEANKKHRTGGKNGKLINAYKKVEYDKDWMYYREELFPYVPEECEKDYGPSNPWDAPGMTISDFIKGVY